MDSTTTLTTSREEITEGLRALANLLEDPTVPAPYGIHVQHCADTAQKVHDFAAEHDLPVVTTYHNGHRHTTATVRISQHVEYISVHITDEVVR